MTPAVESARNLSIELEGGDGVGKHHLAIHLAMELMERGHQVIFTDYPQYWSRAGSVIRAMLRDEDVQIYLQQKDPVEEAHIRMALFALDRATTFGVLEHFRDLYPEGIRVSDRGFRSNCITLAYMVANGRLTLEQAQQIARESFYNVDLELMREWPGFAFLLTSQDATDNGKPVERHVDSYELPPVQEAARAIYAGIFPQDRYLITRKDGNWRSVTDCVEELLKREDFDLWLAPPAAHNSTALGQIHFVSPVNYINFTGVKRKTILREFDDMWSRYSSNPDSKVELMLAEKAFAEYLFQHMTMGEFALGCGRHGVKAIQRIRQRAPEVVQLFNRFDPKLGYFLQNM